MKEQIKSLAYEAIQTRWQPIAEATTMDEINTVIATTTCPFCEVRRNMPCIGCPLHTDQGCCDGLYNEFCEMTAMHDFILVHNAAVRVRDFIKTFTEE